MLHSAFRKFRFLQWLIVAIAVAFCSHAYAASPSWTFEPAKVGRVLYSGGWVSDHLLTQVAITPEFTFPIQLVYLNNRANSGLFGNQWFCPQLETIVVPRGQGTLFWTTPSGSILGFRRDTASDAQDDFISMDRNWRAKLTGDSCGI